MSFSPLDSELLGPLFVTPAMAAVFSARASVAAMLRAEAALAAAQADAGLAPDGLAGAIAAIRAEDMDLAALGEETAAAGVPVIPFVKAVQKRLPAQFEQWFHRGATTQDIADSALVLQARAGFDLIATDLSAIIGGLARLAETHRETPAAGRTYGQHAAPVTFGFKVAVWLSGIADAAAALPHVRERIEVVSLGGPVGTLAALGDKGLAVLEGFARELGLGTTAIAWHTARGRIAETGAWLGTLVGALAKLATDVVHLSSTEIGEVAEAHAPGRGGSSAMPHKRNPVSATVILAAHQAAAPQVAGLISAMAAAHERPAGAWHAEWHLLAALFGLASGALREAARIATGLAVDPARMAANLALTRGLLFADAAAAALAPSLGRAGAQQAVAAAADRCRAGGGTLREELAGAGDEAALEAAFSLAPAIAAGAAFTDRAVAEARRALALLQPGKA